MLSETALSIMSITGAIALGAMSPGQSFILVARTAVASSRGDGMAVALGRAPGALSSRCWLCLGCSRCCWRCRGYRNAQAAGRHLISSIWRSTCCVVPTGR